MEHYSHPLDLPVSEMHMKLVGQVSSNPESHHFYASMPVTGNTMLGSCMTTNNHAGHTESSGGSTGSKQIHMPDMSGNLNASMTNNLAGEKTPLPVKRKAEVVPQLNSSISQQSVLPNKRPSHMGANNSAGFLQTSAPQRKTAQTQSKPGSPAIPAQNSSNKKMLRNDSTSGKSGLQRGSSAKKQSAQIEPVSKARPESAEATRSKMRESLAAALALAVKKQDSVSTTQNDQSEAAITHQPTNASVSERGLDMGGHVPVSGSRGSKEPGPKESDVLNNTNESQVFPSELPPNVSNVNNEQGFQGFQYASILPDGDISFGDNFFAKDDLLQGNGLSWAFDFDAQIGEAKEAQPAEKPEPIKVESQGQEEKKYVLTPENLAFEIEDELFKLFGDVNKKYREKGRSLLFNLKDRNNPDLRERVMSGEIPPEKLCSMSAEDLASKELSQWRMAKAEELGKMVVLPDTEVDIRRLVKKTHKGEYQVEVEHDDGIAAEVSSGTSMLTQTHPPPKKEAEPHSPSKESIRDKGDDEDFSGSLIIPTDGTDLMQGMMVDELKDAELLPPIVSLDEFMESLNNEPPFENLPGNVAQKTPKPHGESPKLRIDSQAFGRASESPRDALVKKASVFKKQDGTVKSSGSPAEQKGSPIVVPKVEYLWNGILQLNISSSVTVGCLFQSGEKTSTKDWPASLEIKGRVRLDAFGKFLQELPNSRTRAVMVLQFVLKDTSSTTQRANLSEAVDSYVADERLGYAEPAPGVELYLCPPTPRILDTLKKLNLKENPGSDKIVENGLVGVVVWRRAHVSNTTVSPNSSSHHKHAHAASKKQQPFARAQDLSVVNANTSTRAPHHHITNNNPEKDEDDDIPPGFGPGAPARLVAKDDDDLPEFNFSGELRANASIHKVSPNNMNFGSTIRQRPVDQVRELIKKYGQSDTNNEINRNRVTNNMNMGIEPWNDDEDDDIPEWRPQGALNLQFGVEK
ncbi:SPOC domain / Transcription elongation factor S-II protein [Striga hermonthica]|uniref:SPOC domain / Transcription elongation factor S-II protein n=1 Tax=Striga hermonthica TaxID=68872 RepID=A0A9N7R4G7_STRHE|nr:SPOC domain / Transcription elongation factor S-II protein [Striga hermonthica]